MFYEANDGRCFLVTCSVDTSFGTIGFGKRLGAKKLKWASTEKCKKAINVENNCITPLAAVHEWEEDVYVFLDKNLRDHSLCLPSLWNTMTICMSFDDLVQFLEKNGKKAFTINFEDNSSDLTSFAPPRVPSTGVASVGEVTSGLNIPFTLPPLNLDNLNSERMNEFYDAVHEKVSKKIPVGDLDVEVLIWNMHDKRPFLRMPIVRGDIEVLAIIYDCCDLYKVGYEKRDMVMLFKDESCRNVAKRVLDKLLPIEAYYKKIGKTIKYIWVGWGYPDLEAVAGITRTELKLGKIELLNMVEYLSNATHGPPTQDMGLQILSSTQFFPEAFRGCQQKVFVVQYFHQSRQIPPHLVYLQYLWSAVSHKLQQNPDKHPTFDVFFGGRQTNSELFSNYRLLKNIPEEELMKPRFTFEQLNRYGMYMRSISEFKELLKTVKSSNRVMLTDPCSSCTIDLIKHMCGGNLILHFECSCYVPKHSIKNVVISVTMKPEGLDDETHVMRIQSLCEATKNTFLCFTRGAAMSVGTIKCQLTYDFIDAGRLTQSQTIQLKDVEIVLKDYLISTKKLIDFETEWEKLKDCESRKKIVFPVSNLEDATRKICDLLDMKQFRAEDLPLELPSVPEKLSFYSEYCNPGLPWVLVRAIFKRGCVGNLILDLSVRCTFQPIRLGLIDMVACYVSSTTNQV